uniref:Uncharacterized protein n=1 Tax=Acrobeloides nanus TaxID=290746 RepID=A0A914DB15_9BILA
MQRSWTSSAFLFPHKDLWSSNEVFASSFERNYTSANIQQFFEDIKYPTGWLQYQRIAPALTLDPPGVEVYCIYGSHVNTPEKLTWAKGYFPDYQPTVIYGDGDGTVNRRSLEACKAWNETNNAGKLVHLQELSGADHMTILKDQRAIKAIQDILYKN